MAGITNAPFRTLCRELTPPAPAGHVPGLFVSEMITTRALLERDAKTMRLISFAPGERPRSVQLYGVDPAVVGEAVRVVLGENLADHVDLNFGCPVPKVTRRGGGAALPYRRPLLRDILRAAVRAAQRERPDAPVTMKMRTGIDADHLTFLDAGRIAQEEGVAAVALHGRTAAQHYSGQADWTAIAELKQALRIPVLGNGDVFSAGDALRMMRATGCDGVVVGRGCLGRPWLFADLGAAFAGHKRRAAPSLGSVAAMMLRHAGLLAEWAGADKGVREFRKHVAWYTKGFAVGPRLRARLGQVSTLDELAAALAELDADQPWPAAIADAPRGRTSSGLRRVALPAGWLEDAQASEVPVDAELAHSGG
jgi:nifR3 family TIM-barrel protein